MTADNYLIGEYLRISYRPTLQTADNVLTVGFHKFETTILPPSFHRPYCLPRLPGAFLRTLKSFYNLHAICIPLGSIIEVSG